MRIMRLTWCLEVSNSLRCKRNPSLQLDQLVAYQKFEGLKVDNAMPDMVVNVEDKEV